MGGGGGDGKEAVDSLVENLLNCSFKALGFPNIRVPYPLHYASTIF